MAYRKGTSVITYSPSFIPFVVVYQMVMAAVRLYDWLVYRIRIRGRENLRGLRGAVLVSNHTLLFDPGIIAHAIRPFRTYFTMLEETALIPYLGTFVRLLGGVPIPERAGALRTLVSAARRAVEGLGFIHFFPEGECYQGNQEIMRFHWGAFLLAHRLGLPVVPITTVLHERRWRGRNTVRLMGRAIRLPPRVTLVIGAPMHAPGLRPAAPLKAAAAAWAEMVRDAMQEVIDREGGSRTMFRGKMPRLVRRPGSAA